MLKGKTLMELAEEVGRQERAKKDVVTFPVNLNFNRGNLSILEGTRHEVVFDGGYNRNFEAQITGYLGVPDSYVQKLKTENQIRLLDDNLNTLARSSTAPRMVRTLDGTARAFLSDRYRRIDNYQVMTMALPILQDLPGLTIESCEITENRLYLKVVNSRMTADIKVGDTVQSGMVISNSEIGRGALSVSPLLYRLVCSNGMIINDLASRTYHVGSKEEQGVLDMYSDETLRLEDQTLLSKLSDLIRGVSEQVQFDKVVALARGTADIRFSNSPVNTALAAAKKNQLNEKESASVLESYLSNHDYSLWGLANAFTAAAQSVPSYDRSTDMERIGYRVMNMPFSEFKILDAEEV